jgi:cell volume regulation protein A
LTVAAGSPADGHRIDDLPDLPEDAWISLVVRENQLLAVKGTTPLRAGDQLLVIADPRLHDRLVATFSPGGDPAASGSN